MIARPGSEPRWEGVYLHSDGYLSHAGRLIHLMGERYFCGRGEELARYLIDQHPAGWSYLGGDPTQESAWHGGSGSRLGQLEYGSSAYQHEQARNISYQTRPGERKTFRLLTPALYGSEPLWLYLLEEHALRVIHAGGGEAGYPFSILNEHIDWVGEERRLRGE